MNFLDDSLFPENQEDLVITAAPYGPEWMPADFPEDLPVSMDEHVQMAKLLGVHCQRTCYSGISARPIR